MTTTGSLVQARFSHVSHLITLLHIREHRLGINHRFLGQLVNIDALNTLTHVEVLVQRVNQIIDAFVVDLEYNNRKHLTRWLPITYLHVANRDFVSARLITFDFLENFSHTEWYEARVRVTLASSTHREGLA